MRVLITGGTGFIGAEVVRQLVAEGGHAVTAFHVSGSQWRLADVADRVALIRGDVGNFSHVLEAVKAARPEAIFHLGAILSTASDLDPSAAMHANVNGTFNLLEAARLLDVPQVLFASSIGTYGLGMEGERIDDLTLQRPLSFYGTATLFGEGAGNFYRHRYGLDFRGIRFPGICGPGVRTPGAAQFHSWVVENYAKGRPYTMIIALHKNARTTPAIRAEIAASKESARVLAKRYGVTEATVYKWKKRDTFVDRSHTAHRLQTTLTPAQEAVVVHLRRSLLLPLDDLLAVTREFLCPKVSRSGLDRCLRRHGVGHLRELMPARPKPPHKAFKAYAPGYVHIDVKYLPQMQDETRRRYLFVAIDRATRWVFVAIKKDKTAASARSFLKALAKACPFRINKVLTDNGKEFTDRLFAAKERQPTGEHEFDQLCQALGIEHRLTKPRTPKTNGMVERFNGRISDVLKTHHFHSGEDLEQTLLRYVQLYNHHLPQSALQSKTPMQAMRGWYDSHPHLFLRRPYDRAGLNS